MVVTTSNNMRITTIRHHKIRTMTTERIINVEAAAIGAIIIITVHRLEAMRTNKMREIMAIIIGETIEDIINNKIVRKGGEAKKSRVISAK